MPGSSVDATAPTMQESGRRVGSRTTRVAGVTAANLPLARRVVEPSEQTTVQLALTRCFGVATTRTASPAGSAAFADSRATAKSPESEVRATTRQGAAAAAEAHATPTRAAASAVIVSRCERTTAEPLS